MKKSKGIKTGIKTTSQLKKELDKVFSQYIRLKYANEEGQVGCYTCSAIKHYKEMQCGHFVSRSHLATRYDENNVRPQCVGCNVFGGGKSALFSVNLEQDIGVGITASLYKKSQQITKNFPYQEKIDEYKEKLKHYETIQSTQIY